MLVLPGSANWFTPVSAGLALLDETVSGPHALGFTLNYPGGSTSDIYISSNGFTMVAPTSVAEYYTGNPARMLAGPARWCPFWTDLNPGAGGTVHFDLDPATSSAVVTFLSVPEYGSAGGPQTFQIAYFPNGTVEMRLQACANLGQPALVGWSSGNGAQDTGSIDISALTGPVTTAPDKVALWLRATLRPVIGNSVPLVTGPIPATALVTAVAYGFAKYSPGVDLTSFGMPGCYQYLSLDVPQLVLPSGVLAQTSFAVPAAPALAGLRIMTQGAAFVPGHNALGVVTSNGLEMTVDVN